MTPREQMAKRIAGVRIYADYDAFRVEYGRCQYLEMKPIHDELFQTAIDLYLATYVVFTDCMYWNKRVGLDDVAFSVVTERPAWWPANREKKARFDLLLASLNEFGRDWLAFRRKVEMSAKERSLWHEDPALVEKVRGSSLYLCRTCSVGHEGEVFYFVYPREPEWREAVESRNLQLFGTGEKAYRDLVPVPGAVAG